MFFHGRSCFFALLFLSLSCQTTLKNENKALQARLFEGRLAVQIKDKKQSLKVDIYADPQTPQFRMDVLNPFGPALLIFIWKEDSQTALFPMNQKYFKGNISELNSVKNWKWILKDLSWARQALLKKAPADWKCQFKQLKRKKWRSLPSTAPQETLPLEPSQCTLNGLSFEWTKRRFRGESLTLFLQKKDVSFLAEIKPKNKLYDPDLVFNISPPPSFKEEKLEEDEQFFHFIKKD